MTEIGKALVGLGLLVALAGMIIIVAGKAHLPLGRLPGDIVYRGKNTAFYFPLATCIFVSVLFSLILYLIEKFRH